MDEDEETNYQPLALNGMEQDEYDVLPLSSGFRFASVEDEHDDREEEDDNDRVPQLVSPSPSMEFKNPLQEAHPASKSLRWLFAIEFLLMLPLLPMEMILPVEWSVGLILMYSILIFVHILMALSMFGLLYDPWHNNIVKTLRVHQGLLAVCSLLLVVLFGYFAGVNSMDTGDKHSTRAPDELTSTMGHSDTSLPYYLGSACVWAVTLLVCTRSFVILSRQKFDISTGTGCCPVIRCRACRVTCFLGLPDSAVGLRYHQHHGGEAEGISFNTLHKREMSISQPRTLPLPGDDTDNSSAHFGKRGSVDYFAPIWKTHAATLPPRRNSDIDTPRLSGSAPSEWTRWPGATPLEIKKKDSPFMVSRSVGHEPIMPFGGKNQAGMRAPLLAHRDSP